VKDQKIYPSEQLWENIRTSIHGDRSWPALTFIALFIITILTIATIVNYPPKTIITKTSNTGKITDHFVQSVPASGNIAEVKETLQEQINPGNYTTKTLAYIKKNNADLLLTGEKRPRVNQNILLIIPGGTPALTNVPNKLQLNNNKVTLRSSSVMTNSEGRQQDGNNQAISSGIENQDNEIAAPSSSNGKTSLSSAVFSRKRRTNKNEEHFGIHNDDENPGADNYLNDFGYEPKKEVRTKSNFEMQLYVTPSISYRQLEDDKIRMLYSSNPPASNVSANTLTNINNLVRHTPALGMELGAGLLYHLTPNLKLKTGLQFNVRQYYIDASRTYGIATIAIVRDNHLDSVNLLSMFSNSRGLYNTTIDNKLYQLSIPLGFQWDFIPGKKLGISFGASVEPTFTLNKNVYMISTDYKYYANGAPFFRKWNFNTSMDLNITYQTGNLKWYIGPQIRYQHLPTYTDIYPIKEYRWDYGLKIGLSLPFYK
jgi:hypothetical protein